MVAPHDGLNATRGSHKASSSSPRRPHDRFCAGPGGSPCLACVPYYPAHAPAAGRHLLLGHCGGKWRLPSTASPGLQAVPEAGPFMRRRQNLATALAAGFPERFVIRTRLLAGNAMAGRADLNLETRLMRIASSSDPGVPDNRAAYRDRTRRMHRRLQPDGHPWPARCRDFQFSRRDALGYRVEGPALARRRSRQCKARGP